MTFWPTGWMSEAQLIGEARKIEAAKAGKVAQEYYIIIH